MYFDEKVDYLYSNCCYFKIIITLVCKKNFQRKLAKIAENSYYNIGNPNKKSHDFFTITLLHWWQCHHNCPQNIRS
jgi:hypothetical protein